MSGNWTPGPWVAGAGHDDPTSVSHGRRHVASSGGFQDGKPGTRAENVANAHLIAAAPDMAEALEPFVATGWDIDAPEWRDHDTVSVILTIGELRAARAALAKARGETK